MQARLCLGAAIMAIWALQTTLIVVTTGASAQFTFKLIAYLAS